LHRILYTLITVFTVALFCSSTVHAAPKKITTKPGSFFSLTPTVGGLLFSASESESRSVAPLYGLKLSYDIFGTGISNTIGIEGTFNYFKGKAEPSSEEATGYLFRTDAIYSFSMSKVWVPFLAAGIGGMRVDKESGRATDPLLNYGLGVKYFLEDYLALRVDARQLFMYSEVSTRNNFELSAGLTYIFGKERKKPVIPADAKKDEVPQFKMKQVEALLPPPVAIDPALLYTFMDQLGATGAAIVGITSVPSAFPPTPSPLPPLEQRPDALAYRQLPAEMLKAPAAAPPLEVPAVKPAPPVALPVPVPVVPAPVAPQPEALEPGVPVKPPRTLVRKKMLEFVVEFDFAKHEIRPADLIRVKRAAEEIKKANDAIVSIEGHTDIVGKHSPNQSLSIRRATSVKNELVKHGVDRRKVIIRGHSFDRPADSNKTKEGRQRNRRATTVVIALIEVD
jgi:OOP family OmpA-OmpF porin